jgi:hypothetical protein
MHVAWLGVALIVVATQLWPLGGAARWIVIGSLAWGVVTVPVVLTPVVRMHWNAAEAERANRELLESK